MKAFLRTLYMTFFPHAARVAYLELEVSRLLAVNEKLLNRLLAVTTGLDENGKPIVRPEPETPVDKTVGSYRGLMEKEREIMKNLASEFGSMLQQQQRGYEAAGDTPKVNGAIHPAGAWDDDGQADQE